MAKIQTLKDEANGTVVRADLWTEFTGGSATFTHDSTGSTVNFPATTSSSTDGDDSSLTTYSLIDSYFVAKILAIPASGATTSSGNIWLKITSTDMVSFRFQSGNIIAFKKVASVQTDLFTTTWNSVTHAWIRIRESNGTTYWDTSPDGISWVNRWSEANPITLTGLTILMGGLSSGIDTSPGTFKWNNVNIVPYGVKFKNSGTRPRPFAPGIAR